MNRVPKLLPRDFQMKALRSRTLFASKSFSVRVGQQIWRKYKHDKYDNCRLFLFAAELWCSIVNIVRFVYHLIKIHQKGLCMETDFHLLPTIWLCFALDTKLPADMDCLWVKNEQTCMGWAGGLLNFKILDHSRSPNENGLRTCWRQQVVVNT